RSHRQLQRSARSHQLQVQVDELTHMRKTLHALATFAFLSLTAASAHAADKLRLERMDLSRSPDLKFYLNLADSDGRAITGRMKEDFRIVIDSAEQGAAKALQTF